MTAPKATTADLSTFKMEFGRVTFHLLGATPLIYHAMAAKAWRELLNPSGRKSAADKANSVKHDPLREFRDSVYRQQGDTPTRLVFPSVCFKKALAEVALRIPGAKKSEILQLVHVEGPHVEVYGVPDLRMDIVRMADMTHTPDVRTRACLPLWTCAITVRYVQPNLSAESVSKLVQAAGMIMGIGDFRIGKGAGEQGQWEIVEANDPRRLAIMANGGRSAQDEALESPNFFDDTAAELFAWFESQMAKRDANQRPETKPRLVA